MKIHRVFAVARHGPCPVSYCGATYTTLNNTRKKELTDRSTRHVGQEREDDYIQTPETRVSLYTYSSLSLSLPTTNNLNQSSHGSYHLQLLRRRTRRRRRIRVVGGSSRLEVPLLRPLAAPLQLHQGHLPTGGDRFHGDLVRTLQGHVAGVSDHGREVHRRPVCEDRRRRIVGSCTGIWGSGDADFRAGEEREGG